MPAASLTKLNGFIEHLAEGVHAFGTHQLAIALSNTAPGSETTPPTGTTAACVLANVTQISYTNLSGSNPLNVTTSTSSQTSGTYTLVCADLTLTASGAVGPFRYIYLYNTQSVGVTNALIGYYDYGSSVSLANTETLLIDFDQANGVLTLA